MVWLQGEALTQLSALLFLEKQCADCLDYSFVDLSSPHLGQPEQSLHDLLLQPQTVKGVGLCVCGQAPNNLQHDIEIVLLEQRRPAELDHNMRQLQRPLRDLQLDSLEERHLLLPGQAGNMPLKLQRVCEVTHSIDLDNAILMQYITFPLLLIYTAWESLQGESLTIAGQMSIICIISMLEQQTTEVSEQPYLQEGDWVQLQCEGLLLFSEGFKSAEVSMRGGQDALLSLFIVQHAQQPGKANRRWIHFHEPVVLVHRLSSKYLSYTPNFASKSQFKLRSLLSDHCQFVLKPLYRCQTLRGTIVRNREECTLGPASQSSAENVNLVIGKLDRMAKVPIYLKRNEHSPLRIIRKNLGRKTAGDISNLLIYQLGHLEERRWLSVARQGGSFKLAFTPSSTSYGTLLMIELHQDNPQEELRISSGELVAFRFLGAKRYLGFNQLGQPQLSKAKTEDTAFQIQLYSKNQSLDVNSLIKIRHVRTCRYLSLIDSQATIDDFSTFNIFQLHNLSPADLKSSLFVNEVFCGLLEQFQDPSTARRKRVMTGILKEIIKFIYRNKNVYEEFLSLQPLRSHLTVEQQALFAEVGFVELLKDIADFYFEEFQRALALQGQDKRNRNAETSSEYNEEQHIYFQVCLILAAICKDHKDNMVRFASGLKGLFEQVGKIKAALELLYHVFAFSKIGLEVLEGAEYGLKKGPVKAVELLCQLLQKRDFLLDTRIKIVKLFHGLISDGSGEKIHAHEQIVLANVYENRLRNILLTLSNNQNYELVIHLRDQRGELSQMADREDKYQRELDLLYEQLDLLATLCSGASKKHIFLFRDIVSQDMVKKYLRAQLAPRFKSLFLKILVNVYLSRDLNVSRHSLIVITNPRKKGFDQSAPFRKLSNLSTLSHRMLETQVEVEMEEVTEGQYKFLANLGSLGEIKELVKKIINAKLEKGQVQTELIYCLYALSNFLQAGVCNQQQGQEVLRQLARFLSQQHSENKQFNRELVQKFLELLEYSMQQQVKLKVNKLFLKIREAFKENQERGRYSRRIVTICNEFMQKELTQLIDPQFLQLLHSIVAYSAKRDYYTVFLKSSKLYHKLDRISYYFLEMVKSSIPIEGDSSHETLRSVNKVYNALSDLILNYIYDNDASDVATRRKAISNVLAQAVDLLESHEEEQPVNILSQKLMGNFGFFDLVIQLIYQRQKDLLLHDSDELFQLLFRFVGLFLLNSDENFFRNATALQKLKVVFRHPDKGQVKLLWELTCIRVVASGMGRAIFDCWITAARCNHRFSIYIPLGLIKLILSTDSQLSKEEHAKIFIQAILSQKSILEHLLKMPDSEGVLLINPQAKTKEEWITYLTLVLRLLKLSLDASKDDKGTVANACRKFLPLKLLVRLSEQCFAMEFQGEEQRGNILLAIALKLLKKELIDIFSTLYLSLQTTQFEYLLYLAQRIAVRLTIKNADASSEDYLYKNLMFYNKHTEPAGHIQLRQALLAFLRLENPSHFELTPQAFHIHTSNIYLFVNVYYAFLFKICEKLIEDSLKDSGVGGRQVQIFVENVFRRYKQLIQEKLTYSQYVAYWSVYSIAVRSTQEILKRKVGLAFNYQPGEQQSPPLMQGQQYFCNSQVDFVFNSYLQASLRIEKYLYESILILTYNTHIVHLNTQQFTFDNHLNAVTQLILDRMRSQPGNFREKCQLLYCFIDMSKGLPQWEPSLEFQEVLREVGTGEDMNSSNLKYYIFTETKLLQGFFAHEENRYGRYRRAEAGKGQEFQTHFRRVKELARGVLQEQARMHEGKQLVAQSSAYFESRFLNYQVFPRSLSAELVLTWLLHKLTYSPANVDRYYDLLLATISLLKTYAMFLQDFDCKYISAELHKKVELCLKIIFRAASGNNVRVLMVLIQQEIWVQANLLLALNDSLQQNMAELDLKAYDLIKLTARTKLASLPSTYLQGVLQLYNNSLAIYGEKGQILGPEQYPLVPMHSLFHDLKYLVALLLKQFKHLPTNIAVQFFSKVDIKYIDYNLTNAYEKYNALYEHYSIATVYSDLEYGNKRERAVAQSICVASAVEFAAIRMHMDSLNGHTQLSNRFCQQRLQANHHQKLQNFFSTLSNFFTDLFMLIFRVFCCLGRKGASKLKAKQTSQAVMFFLSKLQRVQVMFSDQIYQVDFMTYPQCQAPTRLRKRFLQKLNFISSQLKRQSILLAIQRFILNYQFQLRFFSRFRRIQVMLFLARYISVLKVGSYLIVVVNNALLMVNSIDVSNNSLKLTQPFMILTLINFLDSLLILLIYIIKDLPLALRIYHYDLTQGIGYFGRKYTEKSPSQQRLILALMVLTNRRLIYNLLYAAIVGLIFLNPIFASILLLDVLAHVPSLKTLLLAIWRPKYHLLLTMISYIILQYFFSIVMYFLFKDQADPYCAHLGQCFSFIFFTTFKAVHGFVGYLFQQNQAGSINLRLTAFQIFEDIYVILIYQVIIALILAIVFDSFTVARAEKLKQEDYLSSACIVCNIQRSKFNIESKLGFQGHISLNHNLFSYIDFKYAATTKPFHLLTGFQLAVLGDNTSAWIPDGRARELLPASNPNTNTTLIDK